MDGGFLEVVRCRIARHEGIDSPATRNMIDLKKEKEKLTAMTR